MTDRLKGAIETAKDAEIARLREALESIASIENTEWPDRIFVAKHIASEALKPEVVG